VKLYVWPTTSAVGGVPEMTGRNRHLVLALAPLVTRSAASAQTRSSRVGAARRRVGKDMRLAPDW